MVFVYTTCRDTAEAKKLGKLLVEKRLAACVNIFPIESVYEWQGKVVEDKEGALLIKTNEPKVAAIEEFILKNHSYSAPLAAVVDVRRVNREYKEWMASVIQL
jgi:periplasmic divalent cation tolerance protein